MNSLSFNPKFLWSSLLMLALLSSCGARKPYEVVSVKGSREMITDKYDKHPDKAMAAFVSQYKVKLEKEMNVKVATSDQEMSIGQPESLLTNFTSDQMKRFGDEKTGESCIAVMNLHGHRASMPKGVVTLENMYEIYSFDNKLVLLKLKGSDLTKLFESYIRMGGSGTSSNVRLVGIGKQLKSALVDGRPVDPNKIYTIVTLDYLAGGNDGMDVLRSAVSTEATDVVLRDMMIDYVKSQTKAGKNIRSVLDGRIIITNS